MMARLPFQGLVSIAAESKVYPYCCSNIAKHAGGMAVGFGFSFFVLLLEVATRLELCGSKAEQASE